MRFKLVALAALAIAVIALALAAGTLQDTTGGGSSSGASEAASAPSNCPGGQWQIGTSESGAGAITLTCTAPSQEAASNTRCASGWVTSVNETSAGVLTINCTAPLQEAASSPSACPNGQFVTLVTESGAGVLSLTCGTPASGGEAASTPSACNANQFETLTTESAGGALTLTCSSVSWAGLTNFPAACAAGQYVTAVGATLTCSNVPDTLKTCTSACTLDSVTEAVDANSGSALTLTLPAALLTSYYIDNLGAGAASVCPPVGVNVYIGGKTYTSASCFSLPQSYQLSLWSDGTNWYGIPSQVQWSSLTGFPAACASGPQQFVTAVGATLTCSLVSWSSLTGFPSGCAAGTYVTALGASLTCSNVPDTLQTCSSSCTLATVTEAVDASGASTTVTLPAALINHYLIAVSGTSTVTVCPPSGPSMYVGGVTYTSGSCLSVPAKYELSLWSDGTSWFGLETQTQWGTITGFPAGCGANTFVTAIGATLTCTAVSWAGLTNFPANCAAGSFVYGVGATLTCAPPTNAVFVSSAATCTDTTSGGTGHMMGFGGTMKYTTQGAPFLHTVRISIDWQINIPTGTSINTMFIFKYGTGTAPICNAGTTGTSVGNTYEWLDTVAATGDRTASLTVGITGLSASTAYWFDLSVIDSSTASWVYNTPQMTLTER